ncbi:MAG: tryptophan--tRNA ligase, partial [Anaerolineae bacterium]|nr:tryptophan--tRNA ligase [Anaerolineae bacterium]
VEDFKARYRAGTVNDVEVKHALAAALNAFLDPIRERRALYDVPGLVEEILYEGTLRVREETKQTLFTMRQAIGFTGVWNRIRRKAERRQKQALNPA